MPVLYGMMIGLIILMGAYFGSARDNTKSLANFADECNTRGGQVLKGLMPDGRDAIGCYKLDELEIKL